MKLIMLWATGRTWIGCPPDRLSNDMRTGNTVELERARHALDLALAGERTAVVSGGDAGIFGMACRGFSRRPPTTDMPGSPITSAARGDGSSGSRGSGRCRRSAEITP